MTYEQELALNHVLKHDEWYQILLADCAVAETDFLRIRESLSEADQEHLDLYISLCEELEYRRTCLALDLKE